MTFFDFLLNWSHPHALFFFVFFFKAGFLSEDQGLWSLVSTMKLKCLYHWPIIGSVCLLIQVFPYLLIPNPILSYNSTSFSGCTFHNMYSCASCFFVAQILLSIALLKCPFIVDLTNYRLVEMPIQLKLKSMIT